MHSGEAAIDDAELVRAARDGDDVGAFEELVRRHRDLAFRVALRICRDRADAEDVTQEAIVRAWRGLGGFRGEARFSTWLCRITTNLALNRVTRRRDGPAAEVPETGSRSADPAERTVDAERLDLALRALDALTPEQRACFVLCEIEGLGYEEAAQILDLGVPAVRGRLFRARQDLAAVLARYDANEAPPDPAGSDSVEPDPVVGGVSAEADETPPTTTERAEDRDRGW